MKYALGAGTQANSSTFPETRVAGILVLSQQGELLFFAWTARC
jgi:hypothetical protein